jgi:two-component system, sensor histidine kinase and response regulator
MLKGVPDSKVRWSRWLSGIPLLACALILIGVVSLDRFQSDEFDEALWLVRDFRLARVDVTAGILHQVWAVESGDAAGARREAGEIGQALQRLERSLDQMPSHPVDAAEAAKAVRTRIQDFQRLFSGSDLPADGSAKAASLQTAFQALEADMAAIDGQNATRLRELQLRQKREFDVVLLVALGLLGLVGWGVWRADRGLRRAEQAVQQNESRLRQTIELLPQMVWTCDAQGGCDFVSNRWMEYTGLPMEQHLGLGWIEQVHPDDREGAVANWKQAVASGGQLHSLFRLRGRDGSYRWFETRGGMLRDANGRVLKWFGSSTDVEERKQAETELLAHRARLEELVAQRTQALREALAEQKVSQEQLRVLNAQLRLAEEFARLVADNIPGRVVYWDRELRCRFVNRSFGIWFGHVPEEIIGKTALELRGAEYFETVKPRLLAALAGEEQDFEREEYSATGERAVTRVQYIPDRRDGAVQGFFVLATNITRLKQAEQLLRLSNEQLADARDRADAANRAKSTFLANMSHEIRTPMNAIIGLTHMLRRDMHDPVHRDRLGKIWDAAHHLLQVINDILDISKIEAGRLILENTDFSLDALLTRTCAMVLEPARDKGLELVLDTGQLPDRLHGDPTRLMQALLNLLSNAVKFTEHGSVVVKVELLGRGAGNLHIRFEVRDTGPGIAADQLAQLFRPFAQVDSSSTRRHGGTGLGLTITRHIAELMGGSAGVDSDPGRGSRFWFTVRMAPAVAQNGVAAPVLRGLRALLADDLQDAREAMADMLAGLGMRVDTAANGQEAVTLVEQAREAGDAYALVLLDWVMPRMDGVETAQRIRMRVNPPPAMALVSARDPESVRRLAQEVGIGAILMKPVTPSMLLDALMRLLQRAPLPAAPRAAAAPPASDGDRQPDEEALRQRHRGTRVLLAEDNPVNQEVAAELLQAVGLVVDIAGDGEQAVRMARRTKYALILMDMQMPRLDGLQATRALRADVAFAATPIVAMTANAFSEDRQICLEAGMDDHLPKPVDPRVLYACLLRWLPADPLPAVVQAPAAAPAAPSGELGFAGIDGLDLGIAYQYCAGKTELLARVLQQFVTHSRHMGAAIVDNLEVGNVDDPRRMLHSLRGSSSSIGATQVLALVVPMEAAIKEGAPPATLVPSARALQSELEHLVDAIARRLN